MAHFPFQILETFRARDLLNTRFPKLSSHQVQKENPGNAAAYTRNDINQKILMMSGDKKYDEEVVSDW